MCKPIHETKRMLTSSEEVYYNFLFIRDTRYTRSWFACNGIRTRDFPITTPPASHYQIYTKRHFILVHHKIHVCIPFMKVKTHFWANITKVFTWNRIQVNFITCLNATQCFKYKSILNMQHRIKNFKCAFWYINKWFQNLILKCKTPVGTRGFKIWNRFSVSPCAS